MLHSNKNIILLYFPGFHYEVARQGARIQITGSWCPDAQLFCQHWLGPDEGGKSDTSVFAREEKYSWYSKFLLWLHGAEASLEFGPNGSRDDKTVWHVSCRF